MHQPVLLNLLYRSVTNYSMNIIFNNRFIANCTEWNFTHLLVKSSILSLSYYTKPVCWADCVTSLQWLQLIPWNSYKYLCKFLSLKILIIQFSTVVTVILYSFVPVIDIRHNGEGLYGEHRGGVNFLMWEIVSSLQSLTL